MRGLAIAEGVAFRALLQQQLQQPLASRSVRYWGFVCFGSRKFHHSSRLLHPAAAQDEALSHCPRPATMKWDGKLINDVHLIGRLIKDPVVRYFEPRGKVAKSFMVCEENQWFPVDFWDDQADLAMEHARKGDRVHVHGGLWVERCTTQEITRYLVKVRVRDFQFVLEDPEEKSEKQSEEQSELRIGVARSWQEFFAAPNEWWDNRTSKINPRAPDFKHRSTRESLWLTDSRNPSWVASQIELLESRGMIWKV